MSDGKYLVGVNFNPSKNPLVDEIKLAAANLIDLIDSINQPLMEPGDTWAWSHAVSRLKALAKTDVESAAMWAVKAATKPSTEEFYKEGL